MQTWDDISPDDTYIFPLVPAAPPPRRWPLRLRLRLRLRRAGRHTRKAARP